MKIITTHQNETVSYAAEELKKYILAMSRGKINPEVTYVDIIMKSDYESGIVLGLLDELSLDTSDLEDAFIEDIIDIDVKACLGYIAGSNPRSILMGVYKYCTSAGCRFLRPGPDGDYVPKADLVNHSYKYRKKADYPFRCEIIEGAVSYEHCRETVYYLPKIGMNSYMIEGLVPYSYMHKWYGHVGNVNLRRKGQVTDYGMLEDYVSLLEKDIKRAGLILQTLGHAWMFEKLGVKRGKDEEASLKDEYRPYIALVNGKRALHHGSQFYTNFCYSNPGARAILAETVVDYAKSHPYVDYVHLWLADSMNNWCECDECRKLEPSDHYINLLNEIDEALTKAGLDTRLSLIMYVETVRPPKLYKLNNPKRFFLTVAIGTNTEIGYKKLECDEEIPPYELNNWKMFNAPHRFKCHDEWKRVCEGMPSAVFEYRFYIDQYCDLGHMRISRETHRDMRALEVVDFQGCLSDKTHRMYMPTSLPMIMMGEVMFDKNLDFDARADEYFEGAFGKDGAKCREYLEGLTELLSPANFRVDKNSSLGLEEEGVGKAETVVKSWKNNPEVAERAKKIPEYLAAFMPTIEDNIAYADDNARLLSWKYLKYHSEICALFSDVMLAGAEDDMERAKEKYYVLEKYLGEHELEIHWAFDVFLFLRYLRMKLNMPAIPYYD